MEHSLHSLSICRTCPRDARESGLPGAALAEALRSAAIERGVQLLRVNCLGACREPCSVAFDAPTKSRLRFSGLAAADSDALIDVLCSYQRSHDGTLANDALPASLRGRLSAVSPKTPRPEPLSSF